MRLSAEDEKLAGANSKIAAKIANIMHGQRLEEAQALLQSSKRSERTAEEIAADALKHMQALSGLIDEIQGKDDGEMTALVGLEKKRRTLGGEIEKEQEALTGDSSTLMQDLGKIRNLLVSGAAPAAKEPAAAQQAQPEEAEQQPAQAASAEPAQEPA